MKTPVEGGCWTHGSVSARGATKFIQNVSHIKKWSSMTNIMDLQNIAQHPFHSWPQPSSFCVLSCPSLSAWLPGVCVSTRHDKFWCRGDCCLSTWTKPVFSHLPNTIQNVIICKEYGGSSRWVEYEKRVVYTFSKVCVYNIRKIGYLFIRLKTISDDKKDGAVCHCALRGCQVSRLQTLPITPTTTTSHVLTIRFFWTCFPLRGPLSLLPLLLRCCTASRKLLMRMSTTTQYRPTSLTNFIQTFNRQSRSTTTLLIYSICTVHSCEL